jgi:RNA polymerase sigma-70 factor (ECF subfamily)
MTTSKPIAAAVQQAVAELLTELHARSGAEKYGFTPESFALILCGVAAKYLPVEASPSDARTFLLTLRVEELALARACAAGDNAAWEVFLTRYREKLYHSALRIARDDAAARELADGLYGELYGATGRQGDRVSKLASFSGRGSLEGWLRTVLAQEFVNRFRNTKRLVSLDEELEGGAQFAAPKTEPSSAVDPRLETCTDAALAALSSDDRFVLAAYYLDRRPLAEVGRMLGVHESTISRKVDKLAKTLRKKILAGMRRQGMGRSEAEQALEVDVRDLQLNIRSSLAQESRERTFSADGEPLPLRQKSSRVGRD